TGGRWWLTAIQVAGASVARPWQCVTTYRGGTFTSDYGDGGTFRGSYRVDPSNKPPRLDESSGAYRGRTMKLIYEIEGDTLTLRIAYMADVDHFRRPQGFDDKGVIVQVYKRVR